MGDDGVTEVATTPEDVMSMRLLATSDVLERSRVQEVMRPTKLFYVTSAKKLTTRQ